MILLVGLGNPGPKYEKNRHNIGFMAVDDFVHRHSFGPWKMRFQGMVSEGMLGLDKVIVLKPQTYMNDSGRSVVEAARFYKIAPEDVFVIYDDLDLAPGKIKVKQGGGHGGHNGLRSMDAHIGKDYWRLRLGIGHPGDKSKVHSHVLGDFAKAEMPVIDRVIEATVKEFKTLLDSDAGAFMTKAALIIKPPSHQKKDGNDAQEKRRAAEARKLPDVKKKQKIEPYNAAPKALGALGEAFKKLKQEKD